jgi:Lipid A 3-O-deacylase (PagL)
LRKAALVTILAGVVLLPASGHPLRGQEPGGYGGVRSFGVSASYSPTSSHILIGDADHRRVWTLGVEYTRLLHRSHQFRLDYEGALTPLFEETDPTIIGTVFTSSGQNIITPQAPVRVVSTTDQPIGTVLAGNGQMVPLYGVFGRQDTYAAAIAPVGARVTARPRSRLQPSFSVALGVVLSARDIPVDYADQFNFMFAMGPGVQFFTDRHTSWRVEYIYRHVSNAGQGYQNPGIDQGVVRVTLSLHH